jgi:hypothetical protein
MDQSPWNAHWWYSMPLDPIRSELNLVHTLRSYFFRIHFNIILSTYKFPWVMSYLHNFLRKKYWTLLYMRIGIKLFKHNVLLHTVLSICGTHCKCEKMIGWKHSSISTTNSMHAKELCRGGVEVVRSELHTHSSISCEHQLQNESERCVEIAKTRSWLSTIRIAQKAVHILYGAQLLCRSKIPCETATGNERMARQGWLGV